MQIRGNTLRKIINGLEAGDWSAKELVTAYANQAKEKQVVTHAFIDVHEEAALVAANESDQRRARGESRSRFDGVPIAIKDNLMVAGHRATAGSAILKDYIAPYDATVVKRLKQDGGIVLGKTNMDEFAMGSSTETSYHGPSKNPWDIERIPGGSSGGSVVAVAEGSAPAALGSDTGGSVRQPASLCGVVGLKPTYGRVSRYGLIALASSLDQIGPIAHTVEDAAVLLEAIEGRDPKDGTSVELSNTTVPALIEKSVDGMTLGVPKEYFASGMDSQVAAVVNEAIAELESAGAKIQE